jgi:DNA polymerase-3 subunit alpha
MFDLWGEAMPVPTPDLDLEAADISIKEKLAWERELMGVYLSEHPFSSFASKLAPENTTLCGQVDAEMVGQTVRVAGMVASVHHLFTKDRRSFASTVLEDLDGRVEVMVWSKVYDSTRELWQEGNILLVEGKVRLRDDRVQLNCDSVRRYQPEVITPEPDETPPVAKETPADTVPTKSHRLVISITQTSDEDSDIACLRKLIDTLKDFPGQDEVTLSVSTEDRVDNLRLANISYCSELHQRLLELVGEDGLMLETLAP